MSVLRPLLSMRGRLVFVGTALLLIAALVAAPSVSGAKPASVKQFIASISGGDAGSLTMAVTNCGGPPPLDEPCTASSTIDLGSVRIAVPTDFQPPEGAPPPTAFSPDRRTWTASFVSTNIEAHAAGGNDKLRPGETVLITWQFDASAVTCDTETNTFTTAAWGSIAISGSEPFTQQPPVPTLICVGPDDPVTDPVTGQTETITGDFTGHVIITFGGDLVDCSDPVFGPFAAQWDAYHSLTQVNITPAGDFLAGSSKVSTSEFDQSTSGGGDSSWYLVCYAEPIDDDHLEPFVTRSGTAIDREFPPGSGVHYWVGILPDCELGTPTIEPPCVSEQFLTTGPGNNPSLWDPISEQRVSISVELDPFDPHRK